jgi:uncharacterized damage-inducible protein DinB
MKPPSLSEAIGPLLLMEIKAAEFKLLTLANAIPADQYDWRPSQNVRSVSEVLVHVANSISFSAGWEPPEKPGKIDVGQLLQFAEGQKRAYQLEKTITNKADVTAMLTKSLQAFREKITNAAEKTYEDPVQLRAHISWIAHLHEHLGQIIAYTRMIGLPSPWPGPWLSRPTPPAGTVGSAP